MREESTEKRRRRREGSRAECEKAGAISMNQNTISDRRVIDAAAYLRKRRIELKLTQQAVADKAEIKLQQYQKFESGERSILTASFLSPARC